MSEPKIKMIVAYSDDHIIGINGKIPWNIPEDLQFFKEKTIHKVVIMGRKTFESIGHPLRERVNIVISSSFMAGPGYMVMSSLQHALEHCFYTGYDVIWIVGGGQLYRDAMPFADEIWVTKVRKSEKDFDIKEGDEIVRFPYFEKPGDEFYDKFHHYEEHFIESAIRTIGDIFQKDAKPAYQYDRYVYTS